MTAESRILASLKGLATGDAIGKQTENLSRDEIPRWYPRGVRGFEGPPGTVIPRYASNRKRQWRFGETTDDTERTIAVARAILRDGDVRHASVGRELLTCKKSVHPGLKSLWEFHEAGDATRVTLNHDGCGAAIPLAIALATLMESAQSAILLAANVGGDSDSVGSVAGSILGARFAASVNEDWYDIVEAVNDHQLMRLGGELAALRS